MKAAHMLWIAYDPSNHDYLTDREQFNGNEPAWGESMDEHLSKQGVDVPNVGDVIALRAGRFRVESRRLERPEVDDDGNRVTDWYWTIIVKKAGF